jgi:hypothetical protein
MPLSFKADKVIIPTEAFNQRYCYRLKVSYSPFNAIQCFNVTTTNTSSSRIHSTKKTVGPETRGA